MLERRSAKRKRDSAQPQVIDRRYRFRAVSSIGRACGLHPQGHRFEPYTAHPPNNVRVPDYPDLPCRNRLYSMIEKLRKLSGQLQDFKTVRVFVEQGTATELKT